MGIFASSSFRADVAAARAQSRAARRENNLNCDADDCCAACKIWPPFPTTFFRIGVLLTGIAWIMSLCAITTYWVGFSPDSTSSRSSRFLVRFDFNRMTWCSSLAFCDSFFQAGIPLSRLSPALVTVSSTCFSIFLTSLLVSLSRMMALALTSCMRQSCCEECCGGCCPIVTVAGVKDTLFLSWTRLTALSHFAMAVASFIGVKQYNDVATKVFTKGNMELWYSLSQSSGSGSGSLSTVSSFSFVDGYNCALAAAILHALCGVLFTLCVYQTRHLIGKGGGTPGGYRADGMTGAARPMQYTTAPPLGYMVSPSPLIAATVPMQVAPHGYMSGGGGEGLPMAVPTASLYSAYSGGAGIMPFPIQQAQYAPQVYANAGGGAIPVSGAQVQAQQGFYPPPQQPTGYAGYPPNNFSHPANAAATASYSEAYPPPGQGQEYEYPPPGMQQGAGGGYPGGGYPTPSYPTYPPPSSSRPGKSLD